MNVNFIITAHHMEEYAPLLRRVLMSYRTIVPSVVLCYNGDSPNFHCNLRLNNRGHQEGDVDLTIRGFDWHQQRNNTQRFIKTGIDTFLLDESAIIKIFNTMESKQCGYAGNRWGNEAEESLATDVIFLDTAHGCPFDGGFSMQGPSFEAWMWNNCLRKRVKIHFIPERIPVHLKNRHECERLKWTMHHTLQRNVDNMIRWGYGHLT